MSDPNLLICLGATKAGTSWLYRYLRDHPECHVRAVKELHYFDTFDAGARDKQLSAFRRTLAGFEETRTEAAQKSRGWQVENMTRRITDMADLIAMLEAHRTDDAAYLAYLEHGAGAGQVVADLTPAYALCDAATFARMAQNLPQARFVFLMRDPVDRLWSHVRMQALRFIQDGETVEIKAQRILNRTIRKGQETHLPARGDYRGTLSRLREAVSPDCILALPSEEMFTAAGLGRICNLVSIGYKEPETEERVHAGVPIPLKESQRREAAIFLKDQYEFVADYLGHMPPQWRQNYARAVP